MPNLQYQINNEAIFISKSVELRERLPDYFSLTKSFKSGVNVHVFSSPERLCHRIKQICSDNASPNEQRQYAD